MQTVVLAAGEGTRMRPLTARRPKPMLPVADRPLLAHALDTAVAAGATRFVVVVGYEAGAVREYLGDARAGVPLTYAVQSEQRGTADAVRVAARHLDDDPFVVLNGDALYDDDALAALYDGGPAVGAARVDDPTAYGVLLTEGGRVRGIVEKPADPPSNLVNAGAYVFPAEARAWLDVDESARGEYELTDVLERVCEAYPVEAVAFERWLDVGRPWELLAANEWKLGDVAASAAPSGAIDRDATVSPDARLDGSVVVEAGATVRAGAVLEGAVLVREGATVGPNAKVRGATLVGPGARIGHAVAVENSVLMENASVAHLSYVGDSVLGRGATLGAGTVVANRRHDGAPVHLTVKGERVSTGRAAFGVVVGDDARTGVNTSLNAGVTLSVDARTHPGETVLRDR